MTSMLREKFLQGMSLAAASVTVVTTDGPGGQHGATVTAMCSVSADPPSLLVCLHRSSTVCTAVSKNGGFCVNLLRHGQSGVSDTFAGRRKAFINDKFHDLPWMRLATGAPVLQNCLAAFDCSTTREIEVGSHRVFFGKVMNVDHCQGTPLVYHQRNYLELPSPSGLVEEA